MKNMKHLLSALIVVLLSGCGTMPGIQYMKDIKDVRGYSDADVAAIKEQGKAYRMALLMSHGANYASNVDSMKIIVCKCFKDMKSKCREKADGLTEDQKRIWIKSNAADYAMTGEQGGALDTDFCSG